MCMQMFRKLVSKLSNQNKQKAIQGMANPILAGYEPEKNKFMDELSKRALDMYQKQCDIKNFSKLVTSDPENTSHIDMMQERFKSGVIDPFEDEKLAHLADNEKFLRDLGLL